MYKCTAITITVPPKHKKNPSSTAVPGETSHSLLLTNQIVGMAPCDSAIPFVGVR